MAGGEGFLLTGVFLAGGGVLARFLAGAFLAEAFFGAGLLLFLTGVFFLGAGLLLFFVTVFLAEAFFGAGLLLFLTGVFFLGVGLLLLGVDLFPPRVETMMNLLLLSRYKRVRKRV